MLLLSLVVTLALAKRRLLCIVTGALRRAWSQIRRPSPRRRDASAGESPSRMNGWLH